MGENAEAVMAAAMALDPDERTLVAYRLLESVEESQLDQHEIDTAWRGEISNRIDDVLNGKVELIPWEQVRAEGKALLAEMRK